ncbi:MAG: histidine phosphatase family protein [Burkholderiales bacterium]|nr:histidine phosphatase family protein [Burkholderiales bacterium]
MIELWLEMHAQTHHNAQGVASGHFDVALTDHGREQARSVLRARYAGQGFDAAYTSDTQRAYDTACLMFADRRIPILQDARLRECDYGSYEGRPRQQMEAARAAAIHAPFPGGESYAQVAGRMRSFLADLGAERDGQCVMLIGHAATLFTLRHLLEGLPLEQTLGAWPPRPWRWGRVLHVAPRRASEHKQHGSSVRHARPDPGEP